ncbi:MAG: hypothetical protein ACHBN1_13400 [Heteroscytonema crispum UTEX LB 1556]
MLAIAQRLERRKPNITLPFDPSQPVSAKVEVLHSYNFFDVR